MKKLVITMLFCLVVIIFTSSVVLYYNVSPTLLINGDREIAIKIGDKYKEEGAKATIFGIDVSDSIKITNNINSSKVGSYEVIYEIKLPYVKKEIKKIRNINIVDLDMPVIKLKGSTVSIYKGQKYKEPGYTAMDEYDGDLTNKVEVSDNIDTKKIGKYSVTYSVKDSSDNKVFIKRTIYVKERPTTTTTTAQDKNGDNTSITTKKGTGSGLAILMYHYFYDESKGEVGENSNWMEIHDFEDQLKYLKDNDYYFPSWQEVYDFVNGKISLPKKSVVITIDDGHKTLFSHAIPLINKYNVKATAFIITSKSAANKLKKYQSENINFQSHTHAMHQGGCSGGHGGLFKCINYDLGLEDLNKSINILGSNDAIAYPYGDVTNNVIKITKAAKFKVGVTTKYGKIKKGMDPLLLPRIRMFKGVSLTSFKNKL